MQKQYLIMRVSYYVDGQCTYYPIGLTDNWEEWYMENNPDYFIEVYELIGKDDFELVVDSDDPLLETGMVFYQINTVNHVRCNISRWKGRTRTDPIPSNVIKTQKGAERIYNNLIDGGYYSFVKGATQFYYEEYFGEVIKKVLDKQQKVWYNTGVLKDRTK